MILLGDSMSFSTSKWIRTFFWILATFIGIFALLNQFIIPVAVWIALVICCLYNAYMEFMTSALFIAPGAPKSSIDLSEWESHLRTFESITTHMLSFKQDHSAPLIVFIHGWRGSSASVLGRAEWFVAKGWHVVICELPGHGQSTSIPRWNAVTATKHMEHHIMRLDTIIDPNHVSQIFFYGHSMGGYICTRLASDSDNTPYGLPLSGLILESPLMLYSRILDEIRGKLKIPYFLQAFHLTRVFRDVKAMHPSITSHDLEQFDIPQWGMPQVPTLCLQAMTDSRLGREHYDATVEMMSESDLLTHHLIESLTHSGSQTNDERESHLLDWLETFDSNMLT